MRTNVVEESKKSGLFKFFQIRPSNDPSVDSNKKKLEIEPKANKSEPMLNLKPKVDVAEINPIKESESKEIKKGRRLVRQAWLDPSNSKDFRPWLYVKGNGKICCKCCHHFGAVASRNDELSRASESDTKGNYLSKHGSSEWHRMNTDRFIEDFCGGDAALLGEVVLPNDRDSEGHPVIGKLPLASITKAKKPRLGEINFPKSHTLIRALFRSVIMLVKQELPFSDFEEIIRLQKLNGVDFGDTWLHQNAEGATEIVRCMANYFRNEQAKKLKEVKFFSIIGDGSEQGKNDGSAEALCVLFEHPVTREIVVEFFALELVNQSDSANGLSHDAQAVTSAWIRALTNRLDTATEKNSWMKMLTSAGLDGASLNMGRRNGIAARL